MFGHRLIRQLADRYEVAYTVRGNAGLAVPQKGHCYSGVELGDVGRFTEIFAEFRPEAVINGAGLIKQRPLGQSVITASMINSIAPHQLAGFCRMIGARYIQISTDCVFSGKRGLYTETDTPDPIDVYGMTKLLGEVTGPGCLTLRTSMIGRELKNKLGLLEWFLAQKTPLKGFRRAIFSGLTTVELARVIDLVLSTHPDASGLYHLSADPISKHDLLQLLARHYHHPLPITPDDSVVMDRSLDSSLFRNTFQYTPPSWEEMVRTAYEEERGMSETGEA